MQNIYNKILKEIALNKEKLQQNTEYLRLCSYNVAFKSINNVVDLFKYSHILVLQEVNIADLNYYNNLCSEFGMVNKTSYNGTRDNKMLLMVCYKPYLVTNTYTVDVKYNDVANRSSIFVDCKSPNGKQYKICCTHLSQIRYEFNKPHLQAKGEQNRLNEINIYTKHNPDMIIGDLNFEVHFNNKNKCHLLLNQCKYKHTTSYDNKKNSTKHNIRVDHVFYRHHMINNVLKSVVLSDYVESDHRPIIQLVL